MNREIINTALKQAGLLGKLDVQELEKILLLIRENETAGDDSLIATWRGICQFLIGSHA